MIVLEQLLSLIHRWLEELWFHIRRWFVPPVHPSAGHRHDSPPGVEVLEARIVPADYTWMPTIAGNAWAEGRNWFGDGGFPDDPTDKAVIRGGPEVVLDKDITIGWIEVIDNFTEDIKLNKTLTLKDGFGMFNSNFRLAPQVNTANLVIDNSELVVQRGVLGDNTTARSEIQVINILAQGKGLFFELKGGAMLGMDLIIGTAGGGAGRGKVQILDHFQGFNGAHVTVTNGASITVNKDSRLNLYGDDGDGGILATAQQGGSITVHGIMFRLGSGEAKVQLPVTVTGTGRLSVDEATLDIDTAGAGATASLLVQSGGLVLMSSSGGVQIPVLIIADEAIFDGGQLGTFSDFAEIHARNRVEFKGTSAVRVETAPDDDYGELFFFLWGTDPKVLFSSGTWYFDVKAANGAAVDNDYVFVQGGKLEITGGTLDVTMDGNEQGGETYIIFDGASEIVGDFATFVPHLAAFTRRQYFVGGSEVYELTAKAPGGGGMVNGRAWEDANSNGLQDPVENGAVNVPVELYDSLGSFIDSDLTGPYGSYSFSGVAAGDYYVSFATALGYYYAFAPQDQGSSDTLDSDVDPLTGETAVFTVDPGQIVTAVDAGLVPFGRVGDFVFEDLDSDGVQDPSEPGVADVDVSLYASGGAWIDSTYTDFDGFYEFAGLAPGNYYVEFGLPYGYSFTLQDAGGNDTLDSDPDATGQTAVFSAGIAQVLTSIDAGLVYDGGGAALTGGGGTQTATLSGRAFVDADADGVGDAGGTRAGRPHRLPAGQSV